MKLSWLLTLFFVQIVFCSEKSEEINILEELDGRIVGGKITSIGNANYQVGVLIAFNRAYQLLCGGAIITKNHILSAAHCYFEYPNEKYAIRAGSNVTTYGGQFISVSKVIVHPFFDIETINYDIAVLKLSTSLVLNGNVQPIQMASFGTDVNYNSLGFISGWGLTKFEGPPSNKLRSVEVPPIAWNICKSIYAELSKNMFCAGDIKYGGKDSCQGDSGGPFVQNKTLTGIVSWGFECARRGYPGVYSKVAAYRLWIDAQIQG